VVLPDQLPTGHPDQQLPGAQAAITLLDHPDAGIEGGHHPEPQRELINRGQPSQTRQRLVRGADPNPPPTVLGLRVPPPQAAHPAGQGSVTSE